jgi:hypothetical protein
MMQQTKTDNHRKLLDCGFLGNGSLEVWWEDGGNSIQRLPKEPEERKTYLKNLLQRGGYDPEKIDERAGSSGVGKYSSTPTVSRSQTSPPCCSPK